MLTQHATADKAADHGGRGHTRTDGRTGVRDAAVPQRNGDSLPTRPDADANTRRAETATSTSNVGVVASPSKSARTSMPGSLPLNKPASSTLPSQKSSSTRPALAEAGPSEADQPVASTRQQTSILSTVLPAPEVAVPVRGPYRHRSASGNARSTAPLHKPKRSDAIATIHENGDLSHEESTRTRVPVRGILKTKAPQAPKFNFRRDIFNYVGESIAAAASSLPSPTVLPHSIGNSSHNDTRINPASPQKAVNGPASAPVPSRGGALWKKLGGAVSAVAAQVPVTQAAARSISNFAEKQAAALDHGSSTSIAREEQKRATSPPNVAQLNERAMTNHSTHADPSRSDYPVASANLLKSVRFNMATLSVVYPINAPQPPGTEANTRRKVNKDQHVKARQRRGEGWSPAELLRVYNDSCRTREEYGIDALRQQLRVSQVPATYD